MGAETKYQRYEMLLARTFVLLIYPNSNCTYERKTKNKPNTVLPKVQGTSQPSIRYYPVNYSLRV